MEYKDIAIVIPIYKEELSHFEQIALDQGKKVLSNYQFIFVVPKKLDVAGYDLRKKDKVIRFDDEFFRSVLTYNRLLLSLNFFERLVQYQYILIYQLDCFVFEDRLLEWCNRGYDYVGAPFVKKSEKGVEIFSVGNGGFSIRNITAHIRALKSFSLIKKPIEFVRTYPYPTSRRYYPIFPFQVFIDFIFRNNTHHCFNYTKDNEDHFWGEYVDRNFDWYKVPKPEEALAFAFEVAPRQLYRMNNNQLPFGCHAWWKYDLDFWRPYIEKYGYSLTENLV